MNKDVIRLECLKLALSKGVNHVETMARAEEYVKFVNDQMNEIPVTTPSKEDAAVTAGTGR